MDFKRGKRAQVTVFIILAIVIVVAGILFFVFKDSIIQNQTLPAFVEPVENSFLVCLEEVGENGISLLESHGGYIESPMFEPGSRIAPFSTHFEFGGLEIPYWFYYSRSNIPKEQIPSKESMEKQLENYIEDQIYSCSLEEFYDTNYEIRKGESFVEVKINDKNVDVFLDMDLSVLQGMQSFIVKDHSVEINSRLGSLYKDAIEIYNNQQEELFLEDYGIDVLRLYAPVDGVEWTCSPMVWNVNNVFQDLSEALEVNTLSLKGSGKSNDYFVVENNLKNDLRFVYSKNWPYAFQVSPSQGASLVSKPVGNQRGLGALGFCYVAYHYVYDWSYPVLVQVYDDQEIFQFPIAVSIKGNLPRESFKENTFDDDELQLCENKISPVTISAFDSEGNPLDARAAFECFGVRCDLGNFSESLETLVPECYNANIIVESSGYQSDRAIYNSVEEGSISISLNKKYDLEVDLNIDGKSLDRDAIISFLSEQNSETISYPSIKEVSLSEGDYEVQVYIYKNSSLKLEATTQEQCFEVPSTGIGALFGTTKEKCVKTEIPEQVVGTVLSGGGSQEHYFSEEQLKSSETIELKVSSLKTPSTIEELQNNYIAFESNGVEVLFK